MAATEHTPRMAPTTGCTFVARAAFLYDGRTFAPGELFPHRELGMTEDAAWNFWRSSLIDVAPTVAPAAPKPAPAPQPAKRR